MVGLAVPREDVRAVRRPAGAVLAAVVRVLLAVAGRWLLWVWRHLRWLGLVLVGVGLAVLVQRTRLAVGVLLVGLLPGLVEVVWSWRWPAGFERWCAGPARRWAWCRVVRRSWASVADECGLSVRREVEQRGQVVPVVVRPRLLRVSAAGNTVCLSVQARVGQTPDDVAAAGAQIASAFEAVQVQAARRTPSVVDLSLVMGDDLHASRVAAMPRVARVEAVPVGRRQDGSTYELRLQSRHTLVVGCSDSGKGSWLWSVCGGLAPAVASDMVRLWGIDLKGGMEVGMGASLFSATAYTPGEAVEVLRRLVAVADERSRAMRGVSRLHRPRPGDPVHVLVVDELASLVAYETDAQARAEAVRLLSRLLSTGRAPGVLIVAFVQDPSKETVKMRNLFTQTVALRLRSADETRMVLGEGSAEVAPAHRISDAMPGTAWVVDADGTAQRVRADYWPDDLIRDVAALFATRTREDLPDPAPVADAVPEAEAEPVQDEPAPVEPGPVVPEPVVSEPAVSEPEPERVPVVPSEPVPGLEVVAGRRSSRSPRGPRPRRASRSASPVGAGGARS